MISHFAFSIQLDNIWDTLPLRLCLCLFMYMQIVYVDVAVYHYVVHV